MSCCQSLESATSWIDWAKAAPLNIFDLIADAKLGGTTGVYENATDFASQTWAATPIIYAGNPSVTTLHTDNQQMVADATMWNMQHLTRNSSSTLPLPLQKVIFLRGGTEWEMTIPLSIAATLTKVEIGFRDNAGTRGDGQATYPVISFTGSFTGPVDLKVVLKQFGNFSMLIWGKTAAPVYSTFESEWIVVP